jgi:hypothetical protein
MLETKKKTLVICPTCESQGVKSILGELNNGDFMVQRFHQGFTIIKSPNLAIICSKCLGTAYVKNDHELLTDYRVSYKIQAWDITGTRLMGSL